RAEDELFAMFARAAPYASMSRPAFDAVVRMLAEGFVTRRGATRALVHRDAVNRRLRARRGARLTAISSGGTIPETGDYAGVLEPQDQVIGTIHEDFPAEGRAGGACPQGHPRYR